MWRHQRKACRLVGPNVRKCEESALPCPVGDALLGTWLSDGSLIPWGIYNTSRSDPLIHSHHLELWMG